MTAIIILAGTLAALICFRWARWLALIALLATGLYFYSAFKAWEEKQPIEAHQIEQR